MQFKKLANYHTQDYNIATSALKDACDVLDSYKKARDDMSKDSDGIYLLLSGSVKLVNKID